MALNHPLFLSTLSLRRATDFLPALKLTACQFLSTLSLRRATVKGKPASPVIGISIHALLAESDVRPTGMPAYHTGFLSTLSLRRATCRGGGFLFLFSYFYPRSPCGERLWLLTSTLTNRMISIHALLAESDRLCDYCERTGIAFLSTLSLRRATHNVQIKFLLVPISIHALLAESDLLVVLCRILRMLFLSTLSLRRATRREGSRCQGLSEFLSTLSLRRATSS